MVLLDTNPDDSHVRSMEISAQTHFRLAPQGGLLVVLSSPSGGGKSTVARALLAADARMDYSVSVTSRPPRGDEADGRDYHFVKAEEFHEMIADDEFYEWAEVHDNFYGTRRKLVDEKLACGKDVVLDLDIVGGLNIKKANRRAVLIFIVPPSFAVLEQRLRGRKTDSEEQIQKRLRNARSELNFIQKYDYAVVNDGLDATVTAIRRIIDAERHSTRNLRVVAEAVEPPLA